MKKGHSPDFYFTPHLVSWVSYGVSSVWVWEEINQIITALHYISSSIIFFIKDNIPATIYAHHRSPYIQRDTGRTGSITAVLIFHRNIGRIDEGNSRKRSDRSIYRTLSRKLTQLYGEIHKRYIVMLLMHSVLFTFRYKSFALGCISEINPTVRQKRLQSVVNFLDPMPVRINERGKNIQAPPSLV